MQVTAACGQRGDLAQGSVDRVLLGRGAQRLLGRRQILVVDLDEGLGHCCPLPLQYFSGRPIQVYSRALGFAHLQFEVLLTAARESANPCDFALVAMLGLPGLRIFEATSADIADLGEEQGRCLTLGSGVRAEIWIRIFEFWIYPAFPALL